MTVLAIDFETANERPDSACAVGLAWIEDGRVARRESRLIRPPVLRFAPGNIRVHGILPADVADAPDCAAALAAFLPDLAGGLVLAHNAGFDAGVLRASLAACGVAAPALSLLCTLQVARRVFPHPAGCGLGKVAARLGIRFAHHDAGEDAYACAEIALAAVRETGAADVPDLARVLGLTTARAGAPQPVARDGSIAARALRAVRAAPPTPLRFAVRGRTGNRYEVTATTAAAGTHLRCTCPAGRYGLACRHARALAAGDVTDLLSENLADVDALRRRLDGGPEDGNPAGGRSITPVRLRSDAVSRHGAPLAKTSR